MSKRNGWELVRALPLPVVFKVNGAVGAGVEHKSMSEEVFPLYFLHIAKTGGTSLTAALKAFYRADEVISDAGNISVDFLKAHEHRINDATFLHGHAQHDVMSYLMSRVRAITLLRDPKAQAVSNFLHVVRDLGNPLRCAAINLGFTEFITTFWHYAVYQTNALHVSITPGPVRFPEELEQHVGQIFTLLDKMFFVGCLEQMNDVYLLLSLLLRLPACLTIPHLNSAAQQGISGDTLDRLGTEYEALQNNAGIAHLLSIERAVYDKAASLRSRYRHRCVEQAFFAGSTDCVLPFTAYSGANGTIHLAGNWRGPEMTPCGPGWWTERDERSTLLIELAPPAHTLETEIYVTHFVNALVFEADDLILGHTLETAANGTRRIRVDLRPLSCQRGGRTILTLRLAREIGPSVPPYYPALALRNFQLV
ncbi:MAG: sulfotransferase family 2 domain-containing protein [Alphaproteobacteria bacterium]|nr:sulfotransferase family 2 domain-containing protein [Alphaproteobacteria bacterium]